MSKFNKLMLLITDLVKQFQREKNSEWSKCTIQEVGENVLKDWKDDKNVRQTKIDLLCDVIFWSDIKNLKLENMMIIQTF